MINSNFKTSIINITSLFLSVLNCCHFLTIQEFYIFFSLVRINNDDQNNDDGNISTDQSEHIIPVEFQHKQSEEITEKGQLRKEESFESQGIK